MYQNYYHHCISNTIYSASFWAASLLCSAPMSYNLSSGFDEAKLLFEVSGITFGGLMSSGRRL